MNFTLIRFVIITVLLNTAYVHNALAQTTSETPPIITLPNTVVFNYPRALKNYEGLKSGELNVGDLSDEEKKEVYLFVNSLAPSPPENASEECRESWEQAKSASNETKSDIDDLKRCMDKDDFKDDCMSKFRRVKNSHQNYETAVQRVSSECN